MIEDFLKQNDENARITYCGRWMFWRGVTGNWCVINQINQANLPMVLYEGPDKEMALGYLKFGDEWYRMHTRGAKVVSCYDDDDVIMKSGGT